MLNASYIYGTAANWKGSIDSLKFIISHTDDELLYHIEIDDIIQEHINENTFFTWLENGKYMFEMKNVNPKIGDDIVISFDIFRNGLFGEYSGELTFNEGIWQWDKELIEDYKCASFLTKNQTRLFINFFYAIHGYPFKNETLRKYFENAGKFGIRIETKPAFPGNGWPGNEPVPAEYAPPAGYVPNPDFKESDFNEIERANIDYLRKLEEMVPN